MYSSTTSAPVKYLEQTVELLINNIMFVFSCLNTTDDGTYCLFREHRWFTTFHKVLWDTLSAISGVQRSSLNTQAKLGAISDGAASDTSFWTLLDWNDVRSQKFQSVTEGNPKASSSKSII